MSTKAVEYLTYGDRIRDLGTVYATTRDPGAVAVLLCDGTRICAPSGTRVELDHPAA